MEFDSALISELERLQIPLPSSQITQLARYCTALAHWNRKINLTNLSGRDLVRRLVAEPVWIGSQLGAAGTLIDVGSGNGSPSIPLAITRPFDAVHLVEARIKRAAFLRQLRVELQMSMITVHHARLEGLAANIGADWMTLQAVAPTESLLDSLRRFAKPTTKVVWITARMSPPTPSAVKISVPGSETEAWVFSLDHS